MAKEQGNVFGDDPFKAPVPHATDLAVAADATVSGINPKAAARIKSIRPSYILSDNLLASGLVRPDGVAAHPIVAAGDRRAVRSQRRLFGWHISINDVDNGVYLPRYKSTVVDSLPNATKHSGLHTGLYHLEVFARLVQVPSEFASHERGRESLRLIKKELIDGVFPFRKED